MLEKRVVPTGELEAEIAACIERHKPDIIVMGDGTWSKRVLPGVTRAAGNIPVALVNEKHSSERARLRYFKETPPRGIWRLIPVTLQVPPVPIDDYAAVIVAEDYLEAHDKT